MSNALAFKLFCHLVLRDEAGLLLNLYQFRTQYINSVYHLFLHLLHQHAPLLAQTLRKINEEGNAVSCNLFLFEWLVTCFASTTLGKSQFSEDGPLIWIWDGLIQEGECFLIRVALGVCKLL